MPRRNELEIEAEWFAQLLEDGPRRSVPEAGGKVCQACGEIGLFADHNEEVAGHAERGDFLGWGTGHEHCRDVPRPAHTAGRSFRYCECCRGSVQVDTGDRVGELWLCAECTQRIENSSRDPSQLLADLAFRRWAGRARFADLPKGRKLKIGLFDVQWQRPGPPRVSLPEGLWECSLCGKIAGASWRISGGGEAFLCKSTCLCEGLRCKECGELRIPRPISERYSTRTNSWWHVPYFVGMKKTCGSCDRSSR